MEETGDLPRLSPRQRDALRALREYAARHGLPPTRAELGRELGVSAQTADFHLRALARKGYVGLGRKARAVTANVPATPAAPDAPASPAPTSTQEDRRMAEQVPLLGSVAAGDPSAALEDAADAVSLPAGCRADFALRIVGESMRDAGILDGDLVFVRRVAEPRDGEIVVAVVGEGEGREATVKRLRRHRGRVILEAANPAYQDRVLVPGEPCSVAGRVVGLQRTWSGV